MVENKPCKLLVGELLQGLMLALANHVRCTIIHTSVAGPEEASKPKPNHIMPVSPNADAGSRVKMVVVAELFNIIFLLKQPLMSDGLAHQTLSCSS